VVVFSASLAELEFYESIQKNMVRKEQQKHKNSVTRKEKRKECEKRKAVPKGECEKVQTSNIISKVSEIGERIFRYR